MKTYSVQILFMEYIYVKAEDEADALMEAKSKFREKLDEKEFRINDFSIGVTDEWEEGKEDEA